MSDGNENGELAQLLEIKRNYRNELGELEVAARTKLIAELAEKKKELADKCAAQLTEKLLEKVAASLKLMLLEVLRELE